MQIDKLWRGWTYSASKFVESKINDINFVANHKKKRKKKKVTDNRRSYHSRALIGSAGQNYVRSEQFAFAVYYRVNQYSSEDYFTVWFCVNYWGFTYWTLSWGFGFLRPLCTCAGSRRLCSHMELAPLLARVWTIWGTSKAFYQW